MNIHIAIYKWKPGTSSDEVNRLLRGIEQLTDAVPGIVSIETGTNSSKYSDGYSHVILVRGETADAITAYRNHPDHVRLADSIEAIEEHGIGVDFEPR